MQTASAGSGHIWPFCTQLDVSPGYCQFPPVPAIYARPLPLKAHTREVQWSAGWEMLLVGLRLGDDQGGVIGRISIVSKCLWSPLQSSRTSSPGMPLVRRCIKPAKENLTCR
jgi:hypothetical protein